VQVAARDPRLLRRRGYAPAPMRSGHRTGLEGYSRTDRRSRPVAPRVEPRGRRALNRYRSRPWRFTQASTAGLHHSAPRAPCPFWFVSITNGLERTHPPMGEECEETRRCRRASAPPPRRDLRRTPTVQALDRRRDRCALISARDSGSWPSLFLLLSRLAARCST
jgi:hypothetical protein